MSAGELGIDRDNVNNLNKYMDDPHYDDERYDDCKNDNRKTQEQLDQEEDDEMIADAERGQY